jgi:hypothetical protein
MRRMQLLMTLTPRISLLTRSGHTPYRMAVCNFPSINSVPHGPYGALGGLYEAARVHHGSAVRLRGQRWRAQQATLLVKIGIRDIDRRQPIKRSDGGTAARPLSSTCHEGRRINRRIGQSPICAQRRAVSLCSEAVFRDYDHGSDGRETDCKLNGNFNVPGFHERIPPQFYSETCA